MSNVHAEIVPLEHGEDVDECTACGTRRKRVVFERSPHFEDLAGNPAYDLTCERCNLRRTVTVARHMIEMPERIEDAPRREDFRTPIAYAFAMALDVALGEAEKRARKAEVERFLKHVEQGMRAELRRHGCEHA